MPATPDGPCLTPPFRPVPFLSRARPPASAWRPHGSSPSGAPPAPLHGRTAEEARAAADRLVATAGIDADRLCAYSADFTHLDEVEAMATRVVAEHPHLDVLVNNAAMAAPERHTVTADGNEIAFQVNFLAHYLLTCLLEPALTSEPAAGL